MRELPEPFDLRVKTRSLAYLFAASSALAVLTLLLPHSRAIMDDSLIAVAAGAALLAALVFVWGERMRAWQVHVALLLATAVLTLGNYVVDSTVLYPFLYAWVALFAFYFFPIPLALGHVAAIGLGYGIVLALNGPPSPLVRWLVVVGTPLAAGLLISRLVAQLHGTALRAEQRSRALEESEGRTRLVLDSAPDAFVTLDGDGVITSWNAAATRLFGWSESEALGVPMRSLIVPPELRERHDERRRGVIDLPGEESPVSFETEFQRRDGVRFPAEASVSRVQVEGRALVAGFIRDISERRRREEEREALLREQAARAEAERVTGLVSGMQRLVDAALFNRTLDEILEDLIATVPGVLAADSAAILLSDQETPRPPAGNGGVPLLDGAGAPGEDFAERVARAREAMLTQHPAPAEIPTALRARRVDSMIGVPLLAEGEVAGVLVVGAAEPRRFAPEDLALLRLAADRVALAISHARVYQREHRIAETLQRSLLPDSLDQPPGLEVAARYLPAASEAEVGGDWYDLISTPAGAVAIVMGDVAGKGLLAASMVGRLRSALRAYVLEGHEPARVVEQLNRLAWAEPGETQMTTLVYAVVDPSARRMDWVNAGHPAPLLLEDGRPPRFLEDGVSVPLGVLPFPSYEQLSVPLEPGAGVVLYTDGLVERPGKHFDDGLALLAAAVGDAPGPSAESLCDHLLEQLVPRAGALDDVALLTLRNLPVPDRLEASFASLPESLSQMRSLMRRWLRHFSADEHLIADVVTACGEAATNAIEHAGAPVGTPFELSAHVGEDLIEVAVRDHGHWRASREDDNGRGFGLMEALVDRVEVTRAPEGTTVRMLRKLSRDGGDA